MALLTCQVLQPIVAIADDASPVIVSTLSELQAAISNAQDGDVITIQSTITIESNIVIGDTNKRITIHRADNASRFIVNNGYPILFQNLVFDGQGVSSQYPMFEVNQTMTFENCVFRNFASTSDGGAIVIKSTEAFFNNCLFENNSAASGGHIAAINYGIATIENSIMTGGYANSKGGAIAILSNSTGNVLSSTVTDNEADEYGGGVYSQGALTVTGTKIYDNIASIGGADIASLGWMQPLQSITTFVTLFADEGIIPTAWVTDYTDGKPYSQYLRLEYYVPLPPAVILDAASLGTADDGKVTGLESGKYYKVTSGEVVSYSKADGTLTAIESEAFPLDGNEITGLTNGETYLVEEFTPAPTTVLLDSASLGTADIEKITGLSAGKVYKVSVNAAIYYTKADGTLTTDAEDAEALTGTEIVGLTNGGTYLVEEYTPPTPEPDPSEEPDPTPEPTPEPEEPTEEPEPTPDPNDDQDEEPTPDPSPTPTPDPEPTPTPTPSPSNSSGSGGSSYSSKPAVTAPKAVVLSYGKAVLDTTKTEYLLGFTDGLMGSKGTVTKAELVQIIYRLLTPDSKAAIYSEKNSFKDVSSKDWYNEAVSSLANAGLIAGGTGGIFNPDKNVTWGEMVSILAKFAEPNHEWKIITRHWAKDALNTAISYRWFEYNDQFNPDGEVTRLEMLNFINTMFDWTTK
jgi:hypothetical protein